MPSRTDCQGFCDAPSPRFAVALAIDSHISLNQDGSSLALLRPTIRAAGSEIWASWNPRRKTDAVDEFFRQRRPDNSIVVRSNWLDNPWFTPELEEERQLDLKLYPERYDHIWEGEYAKAFEGAYFAKQLAQAKAEGRIGNVGADPLLPYKAFFDLGGSGARADATGYFDLVVMPMRNAFAFATALPRAKLVTLAGIGHMLHHAATDRVIEEIEAVAGRAT
jgi:pimeloyl-ACP methyl ester carboxylesterase